MNNVCLELRLRSEAERMGCRLERARTCNAAAIMDHGAYRLIRGGSSQAIISEATLEQIKAQLDVLLLAA